MDEPHGSADGQKVEYLPAISGKDLEVRLQQHRGRVVLIDFWATWCPPCRAALPHTVDLARRHATEGLTVVTVALNDARDSEQAQQILASCSAETENYRSQAGARPQSYSEFAIESRAIPYFKLYDRTGMLRFTWTGTSTEIDQRVAELLAEPY